MAVIAFIPYAVEKGMTKENAQLIAECSPKETLKNRVGQARLLCPYCEAHSLDLDCGRANNHLYVKYMCQTCRTSVVAIGEDVTYVDVKARHIDSRGIFVRKVYESWLKKLNEMKLNQQEPEVLVWNA